MKKILLMIAAFALLGAVVSCSDDDEPRHGDGVFTVNSPMVNHIVDLNTGNVLGMSSTHNKLTIDTVNHKASLELRYNDGSDKTLKLTDLTARPSRRGFYVLSSPSYANFKGYVDFNESSMRYTYTTTDGIRVISTISEVFFLKTQNIITYDDTTEATSMENVMYQFNLEPGQQTCIVKVMDIVHAKDLKRFINITASSVPVTVTTNGYIIAGNDLKTNATYMAHMDSTGTSMGTKSTDKYPFKTFNATVDLENDTLVTTFMMGSSATVVASGRTYPDYTAY
ncbi:MAG: hypothetical protein IJK93_04095 [Muribaculaceae bacterium]|nr:hypothetical protein [Muribaculaceae bacterium]